MPSFCNGTLIHLPYSGGESRISQWRNYSQKVRRIKRCITSLSGSLLWCMIVDGLHRASRHVPPGPFIATFPNSPILKGKKHHSLNMIWNNLWIKNRNIGELTNQAPWLRGVGLTAQGTVGEPIDRFSFCYSEVSPKH